MHRTLWILVSCILLVACTTTQNSAQPGLCKELKHRIIFNGATPNDARATQQRAELGNLSSDYRKQCE